MGNNNTESFLAASAAPISEIAPTSEIDRREYERGVALPWPIVTCLIISLAYLEYGKPYLEANAPQIFAIIVLCCLGIANIFALGCSVQLLFQGSHSGRYLRKNLKRQVEELRSVVDNALDGISVYESDLGRTKIQLSARAIDALALLRRLTFALDERLNIAQDLLRSGSRVALIDADELMRRSLILEDNAMTSVLSPHGGLPPIPPHEWVSTITTLLGEVRLETQRLAA